MTNNQILNSIFVVSPEPELRAQLYPGGKGEGYITVQAFINDPAPLIVFSPLFGTGKFFFSIQ